MMLLGVQPTFTVCMSIHLFTVTSALVRNSCFGRCFFTVFNWQPHTASENLQIHSARNCEHSGEVSSNCLRVLHWWIGVSAATELQEHGALDMQSK